MPPPAAKRAKVTNKQPKAAINVDISSLPRVSMSLSAAALKEECRARGIKGFSSASKSALLDMLIDDTVLLSGTREYKIVQQIKEIMADEDASKRHAAVAISAKRQEQKRLLEEQRAASKRKQEMDKQKAFHTEEISAVHPCKLAPSEMLTSEGMSRLGIGSCDLQRFCCSHRPYRSCGACNFDVCKDCVELHLLPSHERKALEAAFFEKARKEQEQRRKRARLEEARWEKQRQREEAEMKAKVKQLSNVPDNIKKPKPRNRDKNKPLKFIVWSSDGYDNDGWHSYNPPPTKEFNSSFSSKKDANARVKYLFHVENPWGLSVDEVLEKDIDERDNSGLLHLEMCPEDSSRWTVAAVPKDAFKFMSNTGDGYDSDDGSYDYCCAL